MRLFQALKCFVAAPLLTISTGYVDDPTSIASSMGCSSDDYLNSVPPDDGQTPLRPGNGTREGVQATPMWGPVIRLLTDGISPSYIVNVSAGTPQQYLNLDLSFTSIYTWVVDSNCTSDICKDRPTFNHNSSSSFVPSNVTNDSEWNGTHFQDLYKASPLVLPPTPEYTVKGILAHDTVKLGNNTLSNTTILDALVVESMGDPGSLNGLLPPGVSGIVGLGRPRPPFTGDFSILEHLASSHSLVEVSATVSITNGTLSLGGNYSASAPSQGVESNWTWYEAPEGSYWQVGVQQVWLGGEKVWPEEGGWWTGNPNAQAEESTEPDIEKKLLAIVDPNTQAFVFPPDLASALQNALSKANNGRWPEGSVPCAAARDLPALRFVLGSDTMIPEPPVRDADKNTYVVAPEDYLAPVPNSPGECKPQFVEQKIEQKRLSNSASGLTQPGDDVETMILGQQFLARFDAAYSYDWPSGKAHIGLAPASNLPPPNSTIPPGNTTASSSSSSHASSSSHSTSSSVKATATEQPDMLPPGADEGFPPTRTPIDITPINPTQTNVNAAVRMSAIDEGASMVVCVVAAIGLLSVFDAVFRL